MGFLAVELCCDRVATRSSLYRFKILTMSLVSRSNSLISSPTGSSHSLIIVIIIICLLPWQNRYHVPRRFCFPIQSLQRPAACMPPSVFSAAAHHRAHQCSDNRQPPSQSSPSLSNLDLVCSKQNISHRIQASSCSRETCWLKHLKAPWKILSLSRKGIHLLLVYSLILI